MTPDNNGKPTPDVAVPTLELIDRSVNALRAELVARLDGMDKAVQVHHNSQTRLITVTGLVLLGAQIAISFWHH